MKKHIILSVLFGLMLPLETMYSQVVDFGLSSIENEGSHHQRPTINPINHLLLSYEYQGKIFIVKNESNFGETILFEIKCSENDDNSFFGRSDNSQRVTRCVSLDWRPTVDFKGRYWFSLISTENKVIVGYINTELDCQASGSCDYFSLNVGNQQGVNFFGINWSPDGEMMLLSYGSRVRLLYNLQNLFENEDPTGFTIHNYDVVSLGFYPVWSPDQRFIAYEYREENQPYDIHVLDFSNWVLNNGQRNIVKLSEEVPFTRNLETTKPSWSNRGNLLSYLIPSQTKDGGWDVSIVKLYKEGQTLALLPYSNENRAVRDFRRRFEIVKGPILLSSISSSSNQNDLIVFVEDNPDAQNPVKVRLVSSGSRDLVNTISDTDPNNDHVDAVMLNNAMRVAYTSQQNGMMRTRVRDIPVPNLGFTKLESKRNIDRRSAIRSSTIFPGLGQIQKNETTKGYLFLTAATLTLGSSIYSVFNTQKLKNDYTKELNNNVGLGNDFKTDKYNELMGFKRNTLSDMNQSKQITNISVISFIGVYIFNLIDIHMNFPKFQKIGPDWTQSFNQSSGLSLGVNNSVMDGSSSGVEAKLTIYIK
jgi:hypothetical protein